MEKELNIRWLERIQRIMYEGKGEENNSSNTPKPVAMIENVNLKPRPFTTTLTIEISCLHSKQVIVRMFTETGKIKKMFSWYLVKGINVTSLNGFKKNETGVYLVDVIDHEGTVLFSSRIEKI